MKKFTTIIAITLLAALLFTGCDFIPMKHDFSNYGFTFTVAGEVTEKEGNESGSATLYTKYGKMTFTKHNGLSLLIAQGIASSAESKKTLENGATMYIFNAKEDSTGSLVVQTHYFVEAADGSTWEISCVTPEGDYSEDALVKVYTSTEFVTAK